MPGPGSSGNSRPTEARSRLPSPFGADRRKQPGIFLAEPRARLRTTGWRRVFPERDEGPTMNERSIFAAALDIADPQERATYLDQACGHDPQVRRHLDELLAAEGKLGSFLDRPPLSDATRQYEPVTERPGSVIGPYRLMEQIGEGGMGLVFVAEQQEPVRRKVALKVIKPGMDTREVIARFEAERQALALMDHPNIARVLDAGATDSGRPYFVMELVKGVPITDY